MSYTRLLYHIVFRTKYGKNTIPETYEKELHVHLLVDMHPTYALSDFMKEVKEYSSKWLKQNPNFRDFEGWAVSFVGFTYNLNDKGSRLRGLTNTVCCATLTYGYENTVFQTMKQSSLLRKKCLKKQNDVHF